MPSASTEDMHLMKAHDMSLHLRCSYVVTRRLLRLIAVTLIALASAGCTSPAPAARSETTTGTVVASTSSVAEPTPSAIVTVASATPSVEPRIDGWIYATRGAPAQTPNPFNAFHAQEVVTAFEVIRIRPDGSDLQVLFEVDSSESPYPQVDGFTLNGDLVFNTQVGRLEAVDTRTGERRTVFEGSNMGASSWSPYSPIAAVHFGDHTAVFQVDSDGTVDVNPLLIVGHDPNRFGYGFSNLYRDQGPGFPPSGLGIIIPARYRYEDGTYSGVLWGVSILTGEFANLLRDRPECEPLSGVINVRWSAAGNRIAFGQACHDHARFNELWIMDPDTSELTSLSEFVPGLGDSDYDSVTSIDWSPFGHALVVDLLYDSGVIVLNADGTEVRHILDGSWVLSAVWGPSWLDEAE